MGKWSQNPEEMTTLEWIYSPIDPRRIKAKSRGRPPSYQYYDTPDGQDIDKKLFVTAKWGSAIGALTGLIDNRMYSHPPTVLQSLNRFAFWVLPTTGIFTTYAAITYTATNLRGKDDPLNSALGGMVAGSLVGVWFKNGRIGFWASIIGGLFGACKKHSHDIGYELFNPLTITQEYGDHRSPFHDTSLTKIGNRGWTTGS